MIGTNRLRVLQQVARTGSLAGAARELSYTQPAVAHHVAELERELGTPLVVRHGRGVRLTEAGRALTAHADAVLSRLAAAQEEVAAIAGLRAGRVLPLDGESKTLVPRRFFMGGASSMRGFGEEEMIPQDVRAVLAAEARQCATSFTHAGCTERGRQIAAGRMPVSEGGEAFLLAKAELRLALTPAIETGFFVDLGNVWLDPREYRLLDLRANVGFGLRFVTPIGPAALDLGFNVQPDSRINEATFAPHFTIGLF